MQSMSDYYSAIQLRSDRWSALREASVALTRAGKAKGSEAQIKKINTLFDSLAPIEAYWAFPGVQAFDHIRRQFEHQNYQDAAYAIQPGPIAAAMCRWNVARRPTITRMRRSSRWRRARWPSPISR